VGVRARLWRASIALALCACMPAAASAAGVKVKLSASFKPERLGSATTVSFRVELAGNTTPAPLLTGVELAYPSNLGIATSGLGVASCDPAVLEAHGPAACPANSRMGSGSALVEIPIGPQVVRETARVALVAGPAQEDFLQLLASVTGETPVATRIVLSTKLLPGRLQIAVPPIPSLPEAPYASVVQLRATIGGQLTYYERRGAKTIAYKPRGIGLPRSCPRGGFPFAARFSFFGGEHAAARAVVACPRRRSAHR
jgi:hypothetical protein